jgi:hypothetical protein
MVFGSMTTISRAMLTAAIMGADGSLYDPQHGMIQALALMASAGG